MIENNYVIKEIIGSSLKLCILREDNYLCYCLLNETLTSYQDQDLITIKFYIETHNIIQTYDIRLISHYSIRGLTCTVNDNHSLLDKKRYVFYDKSININLI